MRVPRGGPRNFAGGGDSTCTNRAAAAQFVLLK
jgi:hypothetical protein